MGTSYVRQSSMADGDTITAALFNDEFNRLLTAFSYASSSTTGHQHDGTAGEGGNVPTIGDQDFLNKLAVDSTNNRWGFYVEVSSAAVEQIRIQDGAIVPVTDNDIDLGTSSLEFKDAYFDGTVTTDALVADTADINGGTVDGATIGANSATTIVGTTITANTAFVPDASDGAALGTSSLEFSDLYLADGAVVYFGDDQDVSLTHVADTGLLLSSTDQLQFGDSGTYIHQSADGVLDLVSDTEIEINATTVDINGAVDVSGNLEVGGNLTVTGTTTLNGGTLTLGDAATDNVVFGADVNSSIIPNTDSAYDLGSSSQEWRDIYIDGTAYLDAINFNGTAISSTAAELNILDGVTATTSELNIMDGVTATTAELNTLDGVTAVVGELNYLDLGSTAVGTAIASKAVVLDSNKDYTGIRNLTLSGDLTISGDDLTMGTNTSGHLLIADGTNFNPTAVGDLSEISTVANDDVLLAVDTSGGGLKKISRSTLVSGLASSSALSNVVEDTTPQLGGDLDVNGNALTSTSNGNIALTPNGTGVVRLDGNVDIQSGEIVLKNAGSVSNVKFYCESSNAHYTQLQSAAHSDYSGNVTLTLPPSTDTLVGKATTDTLTNKTLTSPVLNTGVSGSAVLDEDDLSSDSATKLATQQSIKAYVDNNAGSMSNFILEDDDGTEVTVSNAKEVKFIGSGITTNWTDTDNGTDGDPYDLTFTIDAAQTGITSLLATDIKIGEDDQTKIDFEDADKINFYAGNEKQLILEDGALYPGSDNIIDLGKSDNEFKDAFFDGTVTADAFAGPLTGNVTGNVSGTAATVTGAAQSNITSLGTLTTLTVDNVIVNGTTIGHTDDTDLITLADGIATVAGEISVTTLDIGGTNVTSTAAELNILDGVTSTATELNILDGVTATTAELNVLDGITAVVGELNALDIGSTAVGTAVASKAVILDSNKDYTGIRNLTITGELDAATLDVSGNVDIDGTLEADGITSEGSAVKVVGKETIWVPAVAMYPNTTNGCAAIAQVELSNGPELKCLDFATGADDFAQFTVAFPKSWNEGTVTFQPFWTVTGTNTGTVAWGLAGGSMANDASINTAFGTAVVTTAKAHSGTSNDMMVSDESGAITIANAAADTVTFFEIHRDVSADDQSGDARLLGIKLFFTTDAKNDA